MIRGCLELEGHSKFFSEKISQKNCKNSENNLNHLIPTSLQTTFTSFKGIKIEKTS
jgi:hypothetical protein